MKSFISRFAAALAVSLMSRFQADAKGFEQAHREHSRRVRAAISKIESRRKHTTLHPKQIDRDAGGAWYKPLPSKYRWNGRKVVVV